MQLKARNVAMTLSGKRTEFDLWDYVPLRMWTHEVRAEDWPTYQSFLDAISLDRDRAAQARGKAAGPFLVLNQDGKRTPVFWCFNHWSEAHLLAAHLPDDQPLYAYVSFHLYTERWALKTRFNDPIARRLLDAWGALGLRLPRVLAGNCQGAPIAESMALQLMAAGHPPPQLVTLDYVPRRRYMGPYKLMFGSLSRFNPFLGTEHAAAAWEKDGMFPDVSFLTEASHGTYFRKPTVTQTANHLLSAVRQAEGIYQAT